MVVLAIVVVVVVVVMAADRLYVRKARARMKRHGLHAQENKRRYY